MLSPFKKTNIIFLLKDQVLMKWQFGLRFIMYDEAERPALCIFSG